MADSLLGLSPFVAFALLCLFGKPILALSAGAAAAGALVIRCVSRRQSLKLIEVGTLALFLALAVYAACAGKQLPILLVRLFVDGGLTILMGISLAVGKPFTLQYAMESVPQERWLNDQFLRNNFNISGAWATAFLLMTIVEGVMILRPDFPKIVGTIIIILTLGTAMLFTRRVATNN
jgi:hypothetical protein